jgi:hypothetical protein
MSALKITISPTAADNGDLLLDKQALKSIAKLSVCSRIP